MKMRAFVALALVLASVFFAPFPALAQERQWSLDATDREVFLVFGVPDTDDVGISFWCSLNTGKASLYLPLNAPILKSGQRADMKVSLDGKIFHLAGAAAKEGNEGRMTVEGSFRLKDKLMAALTNADSISVTVKNRTDTYPLTDADFEGFVNACNGATEGDSGN